MDTKANGIDKLELPDGASVTRFTLPKGKVSLEVLEQFADALDSQPETVPVMMVTHSSLPPGPEDPVPDWQWLEVAGRYRQAQERFLNRGGQLISLVTDTLVGGIYLIHGMSAQLRLIFEGAKVYPAMTPEAFEDHFNEPYPHDDSAQEALKHNLVNRVISPEQLDEVLSNSLDRY